MIQDGEDVDVLGSPVLTKVNLQRYFMVTSKLIIRILFLRVPFPVVHVMKSLRKRFFKSRRIHREGKLFDREEIEIQ